MNHIKYLGHLFIDYRGFVCGLNRKCLPCLSHLTNTLFNKLWDPWQNKISCKEKSSYFVNNLCLFTLVISNRENVLLIKSLNLLYLQTGCHQCPSPSPSSCPPSPSLCARESPLVLPVLLVASLQLLPVSSPLLQLSFISCSSAMVSCQVEYRELTICNF